MKLKEKVKTYSFWIGIISAVLIIVRILGDHFGWFINETLIMDIATGVCGILVLLGILSSPAKKDDSMEETINNLKEQSEQIQTEQNNLLQTIKTDIAEKQLSIEEQIALLKQTAQWQTTQAAKKEITVQEESQNQTQTAAENSVLNASVEETQEVEQTTEETLNSGLIFVPETEVISPLSQAETALETTVIEASQTEEMILGLAENQPAAQVKSYLSAIENSDLVSAEELSAQNISGQAEVVTTIQEVEQTTEKTILTAQETTTEQAETLACADTTEQMAKEATTNIQEVATSEATQETVSLASASSVQSNTASETSQVDISTLSHEQLKELLFELLQRL